MENLSLPKIAQDDEQGVNVVEMKESGADVQADEQPESKLPVAANEKSKQLYGSGNKGSDFNVKNHMVPHRHSALEKIGTQPSNLMQTPLTVIGQPALVRATSSGFQNLQPYN